jgi:hypothetical protein
MLEVALQGAQRGLVIMMLTRQPHMPLMHGKGQQPSPQGDARGETQGLHRVDAHGIEIEQRLRAVEWRRSCGFSGAGAHTAGAFKDLCGLASEGIDRLLRYVATQI